MKDKLEKIEKLLNEAKAIVMDIEEASAHLTVLRARVNHALEIIPAIKLPGSAVSTAPEALKAGRAAT